MFNIEQKFVHKISEPEFNVQSKGPKPQCVLFDEKHVVFVFPKKIKVWNWNGARY